MQDEYDYDRFLFQSYPRSSATPDDLSVLSSFFGLEPKKANDCRVLELCCGTGINLISMADEFPESSFHGVDLSSSAIAEGKFLANKMGLKNVFLESRSIFDNPADFGLFDYIIIIGAFSWFSSEDQKRVLGLCKQHLARDGLVFVNHLVLPYGYNYLIARNMMGNVADNVEDRGDKLDIGKEWLSDISARLGGSNEASHYYPSQVGFINNMVQGMSDNDTYNIILGGVVTPLYFREFINISENQGLKFFTDMTDRGMPLDKFDPDVRAELLKGNGGRVQLEQQIDFLINRDARNSILCHEDSVFLDAPDLKTLSNTYISSSLQARGKVADIISATQITFEEFNGDCIAIGNPVAKAMFFLLEERWPASIRFDDLSRLVDSWFARQGHKIPGLAESFRAIVFRYYSKKMLNVFACPPKTATKVSQKPVASMLVRQIVIHDDALLRLSRLQSEEGVTVFNLLKNLVVLEPALAKVLSLLDGTRDRSDLLEELRSFDGYSELDDETLSERLEKMLKFFVYSALLLDAENIDK